LSLVKAFLKIFSSIASDESLIYIYIYIYNISSIFGKDFSTLIIYYSSY